MISQQSYTYFCQVSKEMWVQWDGSSKEEDTFSQRGKTERKAGGVVKRFFNKRKVLQVDINSLGKERHFNQNMIILDIIYEIVKNKKYSWAKGPHLLRNSMLKHIRVTRTWAAKGAAREGSCKGFWDRAGGKWMNVLTDWLPKGMQKKKPKWLRFWA